MSLVIISAREGLTNLTWHSTANSIHASAVEQAVGLRFFRRFQT